MVRTRSVANAVISSPEKSFRGKKSGDSALTVEMRHTTRVVLGPMLRTTQRVIDKTDAACFSSRYSRGRTDRNAFTSLPPTTCNRCFAREIPTYSVS